MNRGKGARIAAELRQQIATISAELREQIAAGEPTVGERRKLPTVRDLAATFKTSKATIDRVIRELEAEGLLTLVQGSGIYIRTRVLYERHLVGDIFDEADLALAGQVEENGIFERLTDAKERVQVIPRYEVMAAPPRVADLLAVDPDTLVVARTFTYTIDAAPYQVARSYLPRDVADAADLRGPEDEVKGEGTMLQLERAGIRVRWVKRRIESRMPTPEETADLLVPPGTPVFERWGAMLDADGERPVEAGVTVVPADRVAWVLDVDLRDRSAR